MGCHEIIVILPISATSKDFNVYHYPISFYLRKWDNQFDKKAHFQKN